MRFLGTLLTILLRFLSQKRTCGYTQKTDRKKK
eukprot:UN14495